MNSWYAARGTIGFAVLLCASAVTAACEPPSAQVDILLDGKAIMPAVQRMLDNPGVYITGAADVPEATIIMVSLNGKIYSTMLDRELAPDRFLDGFIIKSGPHQ